MAKNVFQNGLASQRRAQMRLLASSTSKAACFYAMGRTLAHGHHGVGREATLQLMTSLQELAGSCKEPPGADRVCRGMVKSAGEWCESLLLKRCVYLSGVGAYAKRYNTFHAREQRL